jgi:inositol-hexakisphosphate kinase
MEVAQAHPSALLSMSQVNNNQPLVLRQSHATFVPDLKSIGQDNKPASTSRPRVASEGHAWTKRTPLPISKSGSARNSRPQQAIETNMQSDGDMAQQPRTPKADVQPSSLRQALQGRGTHRERSMSRGRIHIEKSIEATLANVEPGKNVRSRKASHVMGIFRENFGPGEDQKPVFSRQKSGLGQEEATESTKDFAAKAPSPRAVLTTDDYFTKTASTPLLEDLKPPKSPSPVISSATNQPNTAETRGRVKLGADSPTQSKHSDEVSPLRPTHDPYFRKHDELKSANSSQPPFPASLLQEIREHPNVLPLRTQGATVASGIFKPSEPSDKDQFVDRQQVRPHGAEKLGDDEEHMYKMVYYPHPGPTAEEIAKFKSPGDESPEIEPLEGSAELAHDIIRQSNDSGQTVDSTPSEHIDISVHSKHGKSVFHGDYYPVDEKGEERATVKRVPSLKNQLPPAALSASESEPDSGDEIGYLSQTDDGETTPTATPKGPSSLLGRNKPKLEGPKGAVVLQPYSDQVGGHSQIYALTKRAIMKQLNNRENEFYELIEVYHPDMLKFLPRLVIITLLACSPTVLLTLTLRLQIPRRHERLVLKNS